MDNLLQLAADPGAWAALAALSAMEVVLDPDNLVFIAPGVMVSNVYAGLASRFQQVQTINPTAGLRLKF
jgi:predicted tellurium resistance membrane protein TerC